MSKTKVNIMKQHNTAVAVAVIIRAHTERGFQEEEELVGEVR